MKQTDGELLEGAKGGDREALSRLLVAHEAVCFDLARALAGNGPDAEDVCQDAFLRASRDIAAVREAASFRAWLLNIVVCAHRNRLASEIARRRRERTCAMKPEQPAAPTSNLEREELGRQIDAALLQLDESQRAPIVLHHRHGLSCAEAAEALAMPEGTIKANIHRGLERLRALMTRAGYGAAVAGGIETALLQAPAVSAPASLTAFIQSLTAAGGVKATGAVTAASAGGLALGWKMAVGLGFAAILGTAGYQGWRQIRPVAAQDSPEASQAVDGPSRAEGLVVIPMEARAEPVFGEIARRGGPRVLTLGGERWLLVPPELRHRPVAARKLIEAVAAGHDLKVAWLRNGRFAVLQIGATDEEVRKALADLNSPDVAKRRDATWRMGWIKDVRAVEPLVAACRDGDAEVARLASRSLKRAGWKLAAAAGGTAAYDLLIREVNPGTLWGNTRAAVVALACSGKPEAITVIRNVLDVGDDDERLAAVEALGLLRGDEAKAALESTLLADDANRVRVGAARALGQVGTDNSLPALGKAYTLAGTELRRAVVDVAGRIGGPEAMPLLHEALGDADVQVRALALRYCAPLEPERVLKMCSSPDRAERLQALDALTRLGDDAALELLGAALKDRDPVVRNHATRALGEIGSPRALEMLASAPTDMTGLREAIAQAGFEVAVPLMKKMAASPYAETRRAAVTSLGRYCTSEGRKVLDAALNDTDPSVRMAAAACLCSAGWPECLPVLAKAATDRDPQLPESAVRAAADLNGPLVIPMLRTLSRSANPDLYRQAVWQFGSLGGPEALAALSELADGGAKDRRMEAVSGIGSIGGMNALNALARLQNTEDATIRHSVDYALNKYWYSHTFADRKPELLDKMADLLSKSVADSDRSCRTLAAGALADTDTPKALELLMPLTTDKDDNVRDNAIYALGRMRCPGAKEHLKALTRNANAEVRARAVEAFAGVSKAEAQPILEAALKDPDDKVRAKARDALIARGGERAVDVLIETPPSVFSRNPMGPGKEWPAERVLRLVEAVMDKRDARERAMAIAWLGQSGMSNDRSKAVLSAAMKDKDASVRLSVARQCTGAAGTDLLAGALKDDDAGVRLAAVKSLGRIESARALELLKDAMTDKDGKVGLAVACELASHGRIESLPLIQNGVGDKDSNIRWRAVYALSALGRYHGEEVLPLLARSVDDHDASVRRVAIIGLGNVGGEKARDLLLGKLAEEKDRNVLMAVSSSLRMYFAGDPAVEKALKDFKLPEAPNPKPKPRPQPQPQPGPEPEPEVF